MLPLFRRTLGRSTNEKEHAYNKGSHGTGFRRVFLASGLQLFHTHHPAEAVEEWRA